MHTFYMSETKAELVHKVVADHMRALKNWIASTVENKQPGRAETLVAELRQYEKLYAGFNMQSKRQTAEYMNKSMKTEHYI